MGFAPVAATAILLIAGLATLATYSAEQDAADDNKRRAADDAADLDVERSSTLMRISGTTYQAGPNRLLVDVTNNGSTVIETDGIDVVIDGEVRSEDIFHILVEGTAQGYWAPLQSIEIRIDAVASEPTRVAVIADNGVAAYGVV